MKRPDRDATNDEVDSAEIEDEIIERGLALDAERRRERGEKWASEGAVEALEELTDLSHEEAEQIADQVRVDVQRRGERRGKLLRRGLVAGLLTAILVVLTVSYDRHVQGLYDEVTATASFTTGLTSDNWPINDVQEYDLASGDRIYMFIRWRNLPDRSHDYQIRITDGANHVVLDDDWEFSASGSHDTWSTLMPQAQFDAPGDWRFEIYLHGIRMLEQHLRVVNSSS